MLYNHNFASTFVFGLRLGTYDGHKGTVWSIDVNWDSTKVLTGSADFSAKVWDCETGQMCSNFTFKNILENLFS